MKYFSIPVFLISFFIGILIVYNTSPDAREIMVYPTPDNVGDLLYRGNAENCFNFSYEQVKCPGTSVKKIPVQ